MNLAELPEAVPLSKGNPGGHSFEIAVVSEEDRLAVLRSFRDDWIRSVGRKHFTKPGDGMTPGLKEFAGRLRDIVVCKKSQLWDRAQAAALMFRRTVETSNLASVGYSLRIASSE